MRGHALAGGGSAALLATLLALAACGGISTVHVDDGDGGTGANGGTGGAPMSVGTGGTGGSGGTTGSVGTGGSAGSGAAPTRDRIEAQCQSVCALGFVSQCHDFDLASCNLGCTSSSHIIARTAECGNTALDYIACVKALEGICAVLGSTAGSTPCDAQGAELTRCMTDICNADRNAIPECPAP